MRAVETIPRFFWPQQMALQPNNPSRAEPHSLSIEFWSLRCKYNSNMVYFIRLCVSQVNYSLQLLSP
jgi:hypothetical protein